MDNADNRQSMLVRLLSRPLLYAEAGWLPESAWHLHIPFAFLCIDLLRPRTLVELGTQKGASYCAFCEAAVALDHPMKAFALDHWEGDAHTGDYAQDTLEILRSHHDARYGRFSTLVRARFDDAVADFADGWIDLLHIDGFHTYEAVRHDFETWAPKLSDRAVVLFHDTDVDRPTFGVGQFWNEISQRYPHFRFNFGHGLGVLMVGRAVPDEFLQIAAMPDADRAILDNVLLGLGKEHEYRHQRDVFHDQLQAALRREQHVYQLYLQLQESVDMSVWSKISAYWKAIRARQAKRDAS